ncbi:MAG: prepilin-type N-terminal cleavage/methylation domain-containing protein [Longimicrobiales bacterium]
MTDRRGYSLVELLISVVVLGVVVSTALGFMAAQNNAFHQGADRMSALTNLEAAVATLESEVPTLGTNLVSGQPGVVYLGPNALAFNADYRTNVENDPLAVYYNPEAPTEAVTSPRFAVALAASDYRWPAVATGAFTTQAGEPAPAELLQFSFYPDNSTPRTDDYILGRRVNDGEWEPVAKNLLAPMGGKPFFRYFIHTTDGRATTSLDSIPDGHLPQTAGGDLAAQVRAVRVTLRGTNGQTGDNERTVETTKVIGIPNAGLEAPVSCGVAPAFEASLRVVTGRAASGDPKVTLTWGPALDDEGGEQDVVGYVIWRRNVRAHHDFGTPLVSVPAGTGNTFVDHDVEAGATYRYRIAAQDCTPSLSDQVESLDVTVS